MTNEEAIKELSAEYCGDSERMIKAKKMAIAALKAEPCEDAISRQAVLDGLASIAKAKARSDAQKSLMGRVMFFTEQLPPVIPKPKTGKWINADTNMYSCSNCSHCISIVPEDNNISQFKWCPHCGAKMEGE